MKTVLVPLAEGFEEIEAITIIDVLRRAGIDVTLASLSGETVRGAQDVKIFADSKLCDLKDSIFDAVILPGGMPGAANLLESDDLISIIISHNNNSKLIGAICAAPMVLAKAGLLDNKEATIYPGFEDNFSGSTRKSDDRVVTDGNVITGKGPGAAMEFALAIVENLVGRSKALELKNGLLYQ